jgi:hypothetical protein
MDACSHQDELSFCDIDGVYPASERANECIAPPSADACNRVEACPTADKPFCSDDSMGVCLECLNGEQCDSGEICNEAGECEAFACTQGSAGDDACAAVDASQPYCGPGDICVACIDNSHCPLASDSVCDDQDFQCRGCTAHPECTSLACGIDTGICADEADLVYVDKAGADGAICGTLESPCLTIATGLQRVIGNRNTIVVSVGSYNEAVTVTDKTVTIIGNGAVILNPQLPLSDSHAVEVTGTGDLTITSIEIAPTSANVNTDAVLCSGGTLKIEDSSVKGARDIGVIASDNCNLTITASTIADNGGGGILVDASNYSIVNNFIVDNVAGGVVSGFRAQATTTNTEQLEFNTFARNQRGGTTGFATVCEVSNLVAENNIYMLPDASVATLNVGCSHKFSLFDSADTTAPSTDDNASGIAVFVDPSSGNYHLQSGSPGINAADPAATLTTDFDGDERPQGGRHDMGADEAE